MNDRDKLTGKLIIFTDLDGTLLDSDYSFNAAAEALELIKKSGVPLILCSSKTRLEIEFYREKLKNTDPFISENGGGIFVPKKYFKLGVAPSASQKQSKDEGVKKVQNEDGYHIIKLGADYHDLRKVMNELRSEGFDVKGFGDMSLREVSELTGLDTHEAGMAKAREFDEPFIFRGGEALRKRLNQSIEKKGFFMTQGELCHILGESNKGMAVEILKGLYIRQHHKVISIALGNSPNDTEMLQNADYPVIVQNKNGSYDKRIKVRGLIKAEGIGPMGWNKTVLKLLETLLV